jgi:hypothetical protein
LAAKDRKHVTADQQKRSQCGFPAIEILKECCDDSSGYGEVDEAQRSEMPFIQQPSLTDWVGAASDRNPTPAEKGDCEEEQKRAQQVRHGQQWLVFQRKLTDE